MSFRFRRADLAVMAVMAAMAALAVLMFVWALGGCAATSDWDTNPPDVRYLVDQGWFDRYAADSIEETGAAIVLHAPWYWWSQSGNEWHEGAGARKYVDIVGATVYDNGEVIHEIPTGK